MGDLDEAPGSGLAIVIIWGVKQYMESLSFSLSLLSLHFKTKNKSY